VPHEAWGLRKARPHPDGRIVAAGTTIHAANDRLFAVARFLAAGPQVDSFTASPNPATTGSGVTLTASNAGALHPGSTVVQGAFSVDSNGDGVPDAGDALLGYGSQSDTGTWTCTCATAGWASGMYTFPQAEDNYAAFSDPLALPLVLQQQAVSPFRGATAGKTSLQRATSSRFRLRGPIDGQPARQGRRWPAAGRRNPGFAGRQVVYSAAGLCCCGTNRHVYG
jgi:hypothetical protein